MATERNENTFGGRYLIQDQNHLSGVKQTTKTDGDRPITGTRSEWVKPGKVQQAEKAHAGKH